MFLYDFAEIYAISESKAGTSLLLRNIFWSKEKIWRFFFSCPSKSHPILKNSTPQ
jgi:hypothetical protein